MMRKSTRKKAPKRIEPLTQIESGTIEMSTAPDSVPLRANRDRSAADLVAHLEATGTGSAKLLIARAAASSPAATAQTVIDAMRAQGVAAGTIAKAEAWLQSR